MAHPVVVYADKVAAFGGSIRAVPPFTIATELIVYPNK
jgi:hypothetical protein